MRNTRYVFYDPFKGVGSDWEEVNRLMGRIPRPFHYYHLKAVYPSADISQTEEKVKMLLVIPGLKDKNDVEVNVADNIVYVKGTNKNKGEEDFSCKHRLESCFSRAIPLPAEVEGEKAEVQYKDGILTVEIPKVIKDKK